jgi:PAS domain-containing protein
LAYVEIPILRSPFRCNTDLVNGETDRQDNLVAKSRKSNRWFLRHASDGILILDIEGCAVETSNSFCHMLGCNRGEVMGMDVTQWDADFPPA